MKKIILLSLLLLSGCGGGESSEEDVPSLREGYFDVTDFYSVLDEITNPDSNKTIYITSSNPIGMTGFVKGLETYWYKTCDQVGLSEKPLSVSWENLTTRTSGSGTIYWRDYGDFLAWACLPTFSVAADLTLGINNVVLTANHTDGRYTDTSLTFKKIASPPENVSVLSGDQQLTLNWNNATGATSTNLYWSTSYYFDSVNKIENVSSPYTLTGLDNNTTYHLYLKSVDLEDLESGRSEIMRTTPGWPAITLEDTVAFNYDNEVAIATDSNDIVHIIGSFTQANTNNTVNKYYTNSSGAWAGETISIGSGNPDASIVLDSNNLPHFSYAGNQLIHYYRNSYGGWDNELIDNIESCSSSLAIDGTDRLYVLNHADNTLKYNTYQFGVWQSSAMTSVSIICPEYGYSAIAKDDINSYAHIAFRNGDSLYYKFGFYGSLVRLSQTYARNLSMTADKWGYPHIIVGESSGVQHYYQNNSGGWNSESITGYYPASYAKTSVVIDQGNKIHIAFSCGDNLCYSTNRSGVWKTFHLDRGINYFMTAISVDSLGVAHIVYFKQTEAGVTINYVRPLSN